MHFFFSKIADIPDMAQHSSNLNRGLELFHSLAYSDLRIYSKMNRKKVFHSMIPHLFD